MGIAVSSPCPRRGRAICSHEVAVSLREGPWFCDVCGKTSLRDPRGLVGRYRCKEGCDYDICVDCLTARKATAIESGQAAVVEKGGLEATATESGQAAVVEKGGLEAAGPPSSVIVNRPQAPALEDPAAAAAASGGAATTPSLGAPARSATAPTLECKEALGLQLPPMESLESEIFTKPSAPSLNPEPIMSCAGDESPLDLTIEDADESDVYQAYLQPAFSRENLFAKIDDLGTAPDEALNAADQESGDGGEKIDALDGATTRNGEAQQATTAPRKKSRGSGSHAGKQGPKTRRPRTEKDGPRASSSSTASCDKEDARATGSTE